MEELKNSIKNNIATVIKEAVGIETTKAIEEAITGSKVADLINEITIEVYRKCLSRIEEKKLSEDTSSVDMKNDIIKDVSSNKPKTQLAPGKLPTVEIQPDRAKIIEAVKNLYEEKPELKDTMKELFSKKTFGGSSLKDIPDNKIPDFISFLSQQGADI